MKKGKKKFGVAFGDLIETAKTKRTKFGSESFTQAHNWDKKGQDENPRYKISPWRLMVVYASFTVFLIVILGRAFDLQIIKGQNFFTRAEGNRVQLVVNHAPRGVVYDRNGKVLAQNIPSARLVLDPDFLPADKRGQVLGKLKELFGENKDLARNFESAKDKPTTLITSLPAERIPAVEAELVNLPGIQVEIRPVRYYPFKETTSHLLGYTLEADEEDLRKNIPIPYSLGDQVGKAGVEAAFEDILRGVNGYDLVNTTASGERTGGVFESDSIEGRDVYLSIDVDLQKFVFDELRNSLKTASARSGSAVVLDVNTGEVLAMVSLPSYDNNIFAKGIDESMYKQLISNRDKPLINRSIGSAYPPGSTFKIISSVAGLETGTITKETKITDPGYINLGGIIFNNWLWNDQRRTEGAINVVRALARSTDTFYYILGQRMGEKPIQEYAKKMGLGEGSGIELPGEITGLVPTEAWKLATKGEPWYPGETLNLSIGQGDMLATPMQMSRVVSVFANGGKLIKSTILKDPLVKVEKKDFLKKETIVAVKEGLYQNTVGDGNVGWLFKNMKLATAGKTGTAESGHETPHAWYTGFAPYPNGRLAVTVMAEHAGHGSEVSAPLVKKIFEWWFAHK